jgi:hypothetical protein
MSSPTVTTSGADSAKQYGFVDPLGSSANMNANIFGQGSVLSGGPMGTFNQNIGNVTGLSGPLEQSLSGIARYQANNALNTTAQNFANQGALGSGAAAQAFGQAIANPFAQAQSQLQQGQLGLSNSLMGASGNAYGQALGAAQGLMEHTSGLVAPTTMTNPAYASQQQGKNALTGTLGGAAGTAIGGPIGGAIGSQVGKQASSPQLNQGLGIAGM